MGKSDARASDELSRTVVALVLAEPFLGHLLGQLPRTLSSTLTRTAGVMRDGMRVRLVVNPSFFLGTLRKKSERVAVLKHEVLHVLLRHLFRRAERDPFLYNVAADLVVNQLIGVRWELPDDAITLARFPSFLPDLTLEEYYDLLQKPESQAALEELRSGWHSDHDGWSDSDVGAELAEKELARLIERAADRAGPQALAQLSDSLRALVNFWLEERAPRVDWRRTLRIFGASSRRSRVRPTLRRPSKRYGTFPGNRVRRYAKLAVAIDTSGSMDEDKLAEVFAELRAMWRAGAELTVIESDCEVQRVYEYRGETPTVIAGRGGTAFDPALSWVRESRERYDGCIYLTDGEAPEPAQGPGCPLLWIVTMTGNPGAHLRFGRVIHLV